MVHIGETGSTHIKPTQMPLSPHKSHWPGNEPSINAKSLTTNCKSHGMAQHNDRSKDRKILCAGIIQFYALCDMMMEHMGQNMLSPLT